MLETWYIIGTDLNGCKCPVARVFLPSGLSKQEALNTIRKKGGWFIVVNEITNDLSFNR